ncbi:MAG: hypothetical protein JRF69_04485 [Deltaproteobacteria bacterium]|nr:hypothetical protein [Deltaproteobacteria bacterium]
MDTSEDIRDRPYLSHQDVLKLDFVRDPGVFFFRKHYRTGLRSHIMEVLDPAEVEKETKGVEVDGMMLYPRAEPLKMLRIFRTRFETLRDAEEELRRVRIVQAYLAPDHVAKSQEFLVDYGAQGKQQMLLCGLQEYVQGEVLEPWSHLDKAYLASLARDMGTEAGEDRVVTNSGWFQSVQEKTENLVKKLKQMVVEAGHVPDLAGVGNLILTRSGEIKLVDINNISTVSFDATIRLDDRGYPVCDKSIRVISLLEEKLLGRSVGKDDPIYETFLRPERIKEVKALEEKFHLSMQPDNAFGGAC